MGKGNCENFEIIITGYECLDILTALKRWDVTDECKDIKNMLYDKIAYQYHNQE